jgi:hypothetical protein
MDQARLLGLIQGQVRVEHEGQITHAWVPGPDVAELLEQYREQGRLRPRAELVRT